MRLKKGVVVGSSITGLCAAQALLASCEEVTLIERDVLPQGAEHRDGVPQGRHLHVFLKRGEQLMEALFPGLGAELVQRGALDLNWGKDMRWMHLGGWKAKHPSLTFSSLFLSRLMLESTLRDRIRANPRITVREGATVKALVRENALCAGVVIEPRAGGVREELRADVVVDASGRDSRAPDWLAEHGIEAPSESQVNANLGYASRLYERPEVASEWNWRALLVMPLAPTHRTASIIPVEGNHWIALVAGVNEDYPPNDDAGFLAFAGSVADGEVAKILAQAKPISPIWGYRRTENRWRHYERLRAYLDGFFVVGDAVCAFNPVYGQGMTAGAIGSTLLGKLLAASNGNLSGLSRRFQRSLAGELKMCWFLATSEDGRYPHTKGPKPNAATRMLQRYFDGIARLTVDHTTAYDAFVKTMHLVSSPAPLLRPDIVVRALRRLS